MAKKEEDKSAKTLTSMDRLTISDLKLAIGALQKRVDNPKLSQKTRNKAEKMLNQYRTQQAKTLRLYEKNKKKEQIKGVTKSTLSVKKIYDLIGRKAVDRSAAGEFLLKNMSENLATIIGGGLATFGLLTVGEGAGMRLIGTAVKEMCKLMFTNGAWNAVGSSLLLAGGATLAVVLAKKAIRKAQYANAIEKSVAEDEINKGTVKGLTGDESPENIESLAAQAASGNEVDNETFSHLMSVAGNPYNDPKVIKVANKILAEARKMRAQNYARVEANLLETTLLSGNEIEVTSGTTRASRDILLSKAKREELKTMQSHIAIVATRTKADPDAYKLTPASGEPLPTEMNADDLTNLITYSHKASSDLSEAEKAALNAALSTSVEDFVNKYKAVIGEDKAREVINMLHSQKKIKNMIQSGEYEPAKSATSSTPATPEKLGGIAITDIDQHYDMAIVEAARNAGFDLEPLGIKFTNDKPAMGYKVAAERIRAKYPALIKRILNTANEQLLGAEAAVAAESSK